MHNQLVQICNQLTQTSNQLTVPTSLRNLLTFASMHNQLAICSNFLTSCQNHKLALWHTLPQHITFCFLWHYSSTVHRGENFGASNSCQSRLQYSGSLRSPSTSLRHRFARRFRGVAHSHSNKKGGGVKCPTPRGSDLTPLRNTFWLNHSTFSDFFFLQFRVFLQILAFLQDFYLSIRGGLFSLAKCLVENE